MYALPPLCSGDPLGKKLESPRAEAAFDGLVTTQDGHKKAVRIQGSSSSGSSSSSDSSSASRWAWAGDLVQQGTQGTSIAHGGWWAEILRCMVAKTLKHAPLPRVNSRLPR